MKISKSKQELARIISENGGWRDGAEWAIQHGTDRVAFTCRKSKPSWEKRNCCWRGCDFFGGFTYPRIANYHQTALSRAEYFHLYPEPDADGWIEWNGGDQPVKDGVMVDVKYKTSGTNIGVIAGVTGRLNEGSMDGYSAVKWSHTGSRTDIIAYRLHKPERVEIAEFNPAGDGVTDDTKALQDAVNSMTNPTIEQLAADYRNAKDYAERKQQEADEAKTTEEAKLKALEVAIAYIGFSITPLVAAKQEQELVIADWRDLLVGDVVEYLYGGYEFHIGDECVVTGFDESHEWQKVKVSFPDGRGTGWPTKWRFIHRP